MLSSLLYSAAVAVSLLGVFIFLYILVNKCLCIGCEKDFYTVLAGYEEKEHLLDDVYCAASQLSLLTSGRKIPLIIVDYNLTEETRLRCTALAQPYSPILFCSENELCKIISGNITEDD